MHQHQDMPPNGVVTLLLTDIEGSTKLWELQHDKMRSALELHDELVTECIRKHEGVVVKARGEGDSFFSYFRSPRHAIQAAAELQRSLAEREWPTDSPLKIRVGIHTGDVTFRDRDLYGPTVNRCGRIRSSAHGGQVIVSEAVEKLVKGGSLEDLGLKPLGSVRLKDLLQSENLFQLTGPGLEDHFPAPKTVDRAPNNLPIQVQSYVGRTEDVRRVTELLKVRRLVTLIGAGGCGKTRLALQVAAESIEAMQGGIVFVDLTASVENQLELAIHSALDSVFGEEAGESLPTRCERQNLLLILDNCEHVIEEAAKTAATLLKQSSTVKIIAASREALQIAGELTYRVGSLRLPADEGSIDECAQSEAVQLFIERASERLQGFALTESNGQDIAAICQEVDGIPLAIEHAAGQIGSMSPAEMRERLQDKFRFLRTRDRGVISRHATIRATLDWSYEMLNQDEKQLLPVLSIFRAGWDLKGCSVVADAIDFSPWQAEDALEGLLAKSLVSLEGELSDTRRFKLLQTIKAYGSEKLPSEIESKAFRRLLDYYAESVISRDEPSVGKWLAHELPNLERVVEWACHAKESKCADLLVSIRNPIRRGGHSKRGSAMLSAIVGAGLVQDPLELAKTWAALALLLWNQDLFHEAEQAYVKSGEYYRSIGDEEGLIGIENNLAIINAELGRVPVAIDLFEKAMAGYQRQGNELRVAQVNSNLALLRLNSGDTLGALENFGRVNDSIPQDPNLHATFLRSYALALILTQRYDQAAAHLRAAMNIWTEFEDVPALAGAIIAIAYLSIRGGADIGDAQLIGASKSLEERTGSFCSAIERRLRESVIEDLNLNLGTNSVRRSMLEGEKLQVSDIMQLAIQRMESVGQGEARLV